MRLATVASVVTLLTLLSTSCVSGYNILIALLIESISVHRLYQTLAKVLVESNHSVTLVTSFNATYSHPNFVNLNVMGSDPYIIQGNAFQIQSVKDMLDASFVHIEKIANQMWKNEEVVNLFEKRHSFDAIIMPTWSNNIFLPFTLNFTGPLILFVNPGVEYFSLTLDGLWLPASVVPSVLLPYDENMSFFERCLNVVSLTFMYHFAFVPYLQREISFVQNSFPEVKEPFSHYEKSCLTLINDHHALDNPVPLLPNQIEIGTLNSVRAKPLPTDLEDFMASSGDHGVIYFSLGSYVNSTSIPPRKKLEFVEAFRRVPQKVIWKYESDDLDLPENVLRRNWLPQQDILGHPKTRVYISHCGIQSTQEAKYHGVPVLAVPVAFDQPRNAARMVRKKIALSLSWDTLTADDIVAALDQLVNDTSYAENMRQLSAVLQDQKETPGQRAVWWIEYIIRHKGAPHLQYTGKRLHFLQYICADVLAFLFLCFYISYRLVKALFSKILRSVFSSSNQNKVKTH